MRRRDLPLYLAGTSLALTRLPVAAAAVEGRDYTRLAQPVRVAVAGKVEVVEFFGYWCPHCSALEPDLEAWVSKLPADVNFRRIPVAFRAADDLLQKLYFALESLGWLNALHRKVFSAIHVQRQSFNNEADVVAFAKAQGVDSAKLVDALKSFGTATKARQAKQLAETYRIDSVPSLYVQGRYTTSVAAAGSQQQMLLVLDELIAKVRKGG